jgi:hypothetical protein
LSALIARTLAITIQEYLTSCLNVVFGLIRAIGLIAGGRPFKIN